MKHRAILSILFALCAFTPLQVEAAHVRRVQVLMGTACDLEVWGDAEAPLQRAADAAFAEISRLESILSTYRQDTAVSELNAATHINNAPPALLEILAISSVAHSASQGTFDPAIGGLLRFWETTPRWPHKGEIDRIVPHIGFGHVRISGDSVSISSTAAALDFGAIGKGYALDKAAQRLKVAGVAGARINFGGQILLVGKPPLSAMRVDIAAPKTGEPVAALRMETGSVSTSAQHERRRRIGRRTAGHVIDPRSGFPVNANASVTVWAADATSADWMSTALLVMGPETGLAWADRHDIAAVFTLNRGVLRTSKMAQSLLISPTGEKKE